ncbi:HAD-IIB family hydrolase [Jiella mangrovi]|uniref:sucrose-phosphate synthase n=1 Tax=Jiella mangrovi TaxID=2821407 RepID=A0ABS4BE18_9HYPH|nr:HAD-IIB family hydrolase [Jiella mangrovi]MBP0614421.1 HAD-IIB family hydrolase [Jiella mangrovi]
MFIVHVALQGCLQATDVPYGLTPDTGGHIKYLLELVGAQANRSDVRRVVIVTRGFESGYGPQYRPGWERIDDKVEILRLADDHPGYLAKEDLWKQAACLSEGLLTFLASQETPPAYLHAHYADAATIAATIRRRMGIPFVFTAHSLGRVKRAAMPSSRGETQGHSDLDRRIAIEERAFAEADLVVASSRDEAEVQYAAYRNYDPGKIRIIEPGSDLAAYRGARSTRAVRAMVAPFLRDPRKLIVLAIARPVAKKNLPMLVEAFGRDPWLSANANLLIVAGTRSVIADLDTEGQSEMRAILEAIDRHDLYGKVAIPKDHKASDVPAIYALARETGGVFANPALNEPFGLTLLEAAASGLPIVATDSGGPNDIIERCDNGRLVNPQRPEMIATACREILQDRELHTRYAANGAAAVESYDWTSHAARFAKLASRLAAPASRRAGLSMPQLLVCDIDNTLTGSETCIRAFTRWHKREAALDFAVATGRSLHSALSILEQQNAPNPKIIISSVGTEIYLLDGNGVTYRRDDDWSRIIARGWNRKAVAEAMADFETIVPQAPLEQRNYKLSYFAEGDTKVAARIRAHLEARGLGASVIYSHGRYLDILPARASKGAAITYLRKIRSLAENAVFVAGDSGNDIEMLRTFPQSIIVANFSDALASRSDLAHSYVARRSHALGIIEGVAHFRQRASRLTVQ